MGASTATGDPPAFGTETDVVEAVQPEATPYASPLKLFEYMALGRAIIAPDTENIREILEHDVDSVLFPRNDRTALAEGMLRLAKDRALRDRLGAAAAAKIVSRDLTWRRNAERIIALVEELACAEKP